MLKREVAGPMISNLLLNQADQDFPNLQKHPKQHHSDLYEKNIRKDRNSFLGVLMEYGNPLYEEKPMLVQIVLKHLLEEKATSSAKCVRKIGLNQFDSFLNDCLRNGTAPLYDKIPKNNLLLPLSKNTVVTSKLK